MMFLGWQIADWEAVAELIKGNAQQHKAFFNSTQTSAVFVYLNSMKGGEGGCMLF